MVVISGGCRSLGCLGREGSWFVPLRGRDALVPPGKGMLCPTGKDALVPPGKGMLCPMGKGCFAPRQAKGCSGVPREMECCGPWGKGCSGPRGGDARRPVYGKSAVEGCSPGAPQPWGESGGQGEPPQQWSIPAQPSGRRGGGSQARRGGWPGPRGWGRAAAKKMMENKLIIAASACAAGSIPERGSPVEGSPGGSGQGDPAAAGPGDALCETREAAAASLAGTSNI